MSTEELERLIVDFELAPCFEGYADYLKNKIELQRRKEERSVASGNLSCD